MSTPSITYCTNNLITKQIIIVLTPRYTKQLSNQMMPNVYPKTNLEALILVIINNK